MPDLTYSPGDTITLEKDGDRLVREVRLNAGLPVVDGMYERMHFVGSLLMAGWTITSVTPKPAPLPTEPGGYRDARGVDWILDDHFDWYCVDANYEDDATKRAPFTRLIPESAVAEAKQEAHQSAYRWLFAHHEPSVPPTVLDDFAHDFGVKA
ncbi:hypothetical protein [Gryllotalpicola koreensis]|uniref:Uncharacterized protein n=1 Tax=Gryllotalpicola koreensis TaxID=993086 RepID=A0ABP8A1V4_9MICO